ncbi:hypothetical protein BC834DRAFT_860445 [Gloeopeniophorella convolvens]|nr:hypothetical protein BC834DRAFT_860445 [Gloeopeniophorella convolvens]
MPPKARIVRKVPQEGPAGTVKPGTSTAPPLGASSAATKPPSASNAGTAPREGAMLPPPDPPLPKAILEPELDALATCLRNAAVKSSQIHAFFADTQRLGVANYVTRPPHSLTDALGREIEKYDQICDLLDAQLVRPVARYFRAPSDLDRVKAQLQAEAEAEALRNQPPPEPEIAEVAPADTGQAPPPAAASALQKTPPAPGAAGSFPTARRQSTISLSSLNRPQFPHKLDLSASALRINPNELAQGLGGGLPSPVTLAPKSGRLTSASEFPPDFMAAFGPPDMANRSVDIDLTMLQEQVPAAALDPPLGSSADRPIELDLESMDIDMSHVDVDVKTLFGDEPAPDMSTADLFGPPTAADTAAGPSTDVPPPDGALLDPFGDPQQPQGASAAAGASEPSFDMPGIGEMGSLDFSQFQFDAMPGAPDMGMLDMTALLGMAGADGAAPPEGQSGAGNA